MKTNSWNPVFAAEFFVPQVPAVYVQPDGEAEN